MEKMTDEQLDKFAEKVAEKLDGRQCPVFNEREQASLKNVAFVIWVSKKAVVVALATALVTAGTAALFFSN